MTPERLKELKERCARFEHIRSEHVLELIAEVERLAREREALKHAVVTERHIALKEAAKVAGSYEPRCEICPRGVAAAILALSRDGAR